MVLGGEGVKGTCLLVNLGLKHNAEHNRKFIARSNTPVTGLPFHDGELDVLATLRWSKYIIKTDLKEYDEMSYI